ncbi:MAG TPA: DUF933 domain-containing protein [Bacillota bacterium]|nr:DUF933 domain-containing protein [Bacillota bacterium]
MKVGIVGMPWAGKTTVFRLLTGGNPGGKQDASIGMAKVPDARIDVLSEMFRPRKTTYAQIEVVDLAGGAGLGLGRIAADDNGRARARGISLLVNHMRTVDALIHVVRTFESADGEPARPVADAASLNDELILADMAIAEARVERLRLSRKRTSDEDRELELMELLAAEFVEGRGLREIELAKGDQDLLRGYGLLSVKPVVLAANMSEEQFQSGGFVDEIQLQGYCDERHIPYVRLCASIEADISELPPDERIAFMDAYGIESTGVERVSRAVYECLGLVSFFTVGEDEVRAWPIAVGTNAKHAAGKIHSDIEHGFIRAEIVAYDDLIRLGSYSAARAAGAFRLEGREYTMADGDIVNFRFSPPR